MSAVCPFSAVVRGRGGAGHTQELATSQPSQDGECSVNFESVGGYRRDRRSFSETVSHRGEVVVFDAVFSKTLVAVLSVL